VPVQGGGEALSIPIVDSLVVGFNGRYTSLAERGPMTSARAAVPVVELLYYNEQRAAILAGDHGTDRATGLTP
jgi:hypothetical protein